MPCKGTKPDGSPCRVPENMVEGGYCPAHRPGASEIMAERGRKGAEATARKLRGEGLDPEELPPLDGHEAAKVWLETIGRAVASRRITHHEARAVVQAVEAWVRVEGERLTAVVVDDLREEVDRLKAELSGNPKLRVRA